MKDAFSGENYVSVPFPNHNALEKARTESSKSVNPTTYDRYEKYHYPLGTVFKLGNVIEIVIWFWSSNKLSA